MLRDRFDPRYYERDVLFRYHAGWAHGGQFTRSSPATYFDRTGILREVGPGVLPVEWLDRGGDDRRETPVIPWEPASANHIRNPRGEGAVVGGAFPAHWGPDGASGGLTWEVAGTGIEDGLPYVALRAHGNPTAATSQFRFEDYISITAAPGQVWTGSIYARLAGGSLDGIGRVHMSTQERTGGTHRHSSTVTLDVTVPRLSAGRGVSTRTFTHPETTTAQLVFGLSNLVVGTPVDVTLRVAGVQLEPLPIATAVMLPPVGAPGVSSRAAGALTAPWPWAPGPLSIYLRLVELGGLALPGYPVLVRIGDGDDRLQLQVDSALGRYQLRYTSGGVNRWRTLTTAPVAGQDVELMLTLSRDGVASLSQSIAGGPVETVASSPPLALPAAWGSQTITVSGGRHAGRDLLVLDGADWTMDAARRYLPW